MREGARGRDNRKNEERDGDGKKNREKRPKSEVARVRGMGEEMQRKRLRETKDGRRDGFRRTWELSAKRAVKRSLESTGTVRVYTIVSAANGRTINVARICDWISVKRR